MNPFAGIGQRLGNVWSAGKSNIASTISDIKTAISEPSLSAVFDANAAASAAKAQATATAQKAATAGRGKLAIQTDSQGNEVAQKSPPPPPSNAPVTPVVLGTAADGTPITPATNLATHITSSIPALTAPALTQNGPTTGLMSTGDQNTVFDSMNSAGTDLSSAGSALSAFNSAAGATDPVTAQIESNLNDLITKASTPPPSMLTTYDNLIASSGIQADQASELNLETMMSGTADDIRKELTAGGGFATESQVQAMASQRNVYLQRQLTALQNADSLKQSWITSTMQYTQDDYTNTEANFEKNYQLQNTLLSTLGRIQTANATADYRFQNQQMSQLKFLVDSGSLANAGPSVIASYSATTGIPADQIMAAATSAADKVSLSQALQAALLNQRQGGGTSTDVADSVRNTRVGGFLQSNTGTDGMVNAQTYAQALAQYTATGGTSANFLNQFPPDNYLNPTQIDALPSSVPEFQTIKLTQDMSDGIAAVQAGSITSADAENRLIASYPDDATKIKDAFSALQ